ncbi:MAG: hypothetical protein ACAI43_12280 [Phycisphaerae bacterium]
MIKTARPAGMGMRVIDRRSTFGMPIPAGHVVGAVGRPWRRA